MKYSEINKIDGYAIFEPEASSKSYNKTIYDKNSGFSDNGDFHFRVVKTRRYKEFIYPFLTHSEMAYLKNLVFDANGCPKEFIFKGDFLGETVTFKAQIDKDISYQEDASRSLYLDVTLLISETKGVEYE